MTIEEQILTETYAEVYYLKEKELGKIVWKGRKSLSQEEYKKPFTTLIDLANSGSPVTKFISDTREQGVVNPENRKAFEFEILPAAIDGGLKKAAVISEANVFKRYYLNLLLSAVNKFNLPFKIFGDEESAMAFVMEEK